jgi:uncharacterized membrane protein YeaQ/YmgE (transglycosylase-associated protein family)
MALENPALNERSFQRGMEEAGAEPRTMSASGTYAITGLLFVIVVAAAAFGFSQVEIVTVDGRQEALTPAWTWLVFLLTFIVGIVGAFAYRAAPITSVLYALGEGSLLGIASRYYDLRFEGIVSQALLATLCVFLAVYLLYSLRIVKVTSRFVTLVVAATGAFVLLYLVAWLLSLLGGGSPLSVRSHTVGHRDKRLDRHIGSAESDARFRLHREGSGGGRAEVHAMVRRLRADALADLDLRLRSAAHRATSIQRVGDTRKQAAMSSRKGEINRDNG